MDARCGAGLRAFWSHPIAFVLSPIDRRNSLSSSVSSMISIQINTSSAQNSNRVLCARPQYSLSFFHLHDLPFELKPLIPISQAFVR